MNAVYMYVYIHCNLNKCAQKNCGLEKTIF
jgi:hypothetical protein